MRWVLRTVRSVGEGVWSGRDEVRRSGNSAEKLAADGWRRNWWLVDLRKSPLRDGLRLRIWLRFLFWLSRVFKVRFLEFPLFCSNKPRAWDWKRPKDASATTKRGRGKQC
ncbi:uncharacterized protein LOC120151071 [Hibiscus syriacus]|uniref:uncharacterized protein LOC120151071 n=1 Tax=Hibiscus syriacus TaxID=106335 RepID=UPI001924202D|nr:uncharacterized protein LOC120151071 [Hibiscus syriacus]